MKLTLADIAEELGLEVQGDPAVEVSGIASLGDAAPGQLTFLFSSAYRQYLGDTKAAAVVVRRNDAADCRIPALIADNPRMAWARIASLFDPAPQPNGLHHPTAVVSETASIGEGVTIGANAVIEGKTAIADGAAIGAGCYVGEGVTIGSGTRLFPNVTLYHRVSLGERVIVHSGSVIGADGFGFEPDWEAMRMVKIPQVYGVVIGNDVEIGAGTTIDRGALNDTVVSDGVKLDNQVQIGHGTRIGTNTVISGCTAIAGSTRIGAYCLIGGAVGIIDNIEIVDQVEITAMTLVSQSIKEKGRYSSGTGLMSSREWKRSIVGFGKLDELIKRVRGLESREDSRERGE